MLYTLWVLRYHRLSDIGLQETFRAVVISRLTYVSTALMPFFAAANAVDSARQTYQSSTSCWQSVTTDSLVESAVNRSMSYTTFFPAGLLQLDTVRHLFIQPQQTTACTECPSAFRHDDEQKTRSHHTGVSPSSLAPCYCLYSVQNRTADIQDTHYQSVELHSRLTSDTLLVTTTQVRQSQPAWNSADENRFCSTQFHLQCSTHLERLPHVITGNLDVTANTFKKKLKTFYYTNCYL